MIRHLDMSTGEARRTVEQIWRDAIAALDPAAAVARSLTGIDAPTHVLGAGKAATAMIRGAASIFGVIPGLAISSHVDTPAARVTHLIGDHPLPGSRSLDAGRRVADLCRSLGSEDHLLVLLSGGASALMELPVQGVTIGQIRDTSELLMRAGAEIAELNTVRAHLSLLKGGGLARLAAPATLTTLVVSDVVGDPPHVIGSGPTVPNPTTPRQALEVLDRHHVRDLTDPAVVAALQAPAHPGIDRVGTYRIVSNMAAAARAAVRAAESRGLHASALTTGLRGEAREMAAWAIRRARSGDLISVLAGETTVVVRGDGTGGRNQEAALAAAIEIAGTRDVVFLAGATDGIDGPTEAAGGIVDGTSVERAGSIEAAREALDRNDSAPWLRRAGDQLVTGRTGTNVGDLWVIWTGGVARRRGGP